MLFCIEVFLLSRPFAVYLRKCGVFGKIDDWRLWRNDVAMIYNDLAVWLTREPYSMQYALKNKLCKWIIRKCVCVCMCVVVVVVVGLSVYTMEMVKATVIFGDDFAFCWNIHLDSWFTFIFYYFFICIFIFNLFTKCFVFVCVCVFVNWCWWWLIISFIIHMFISIQFVWDLIYQFNDKCLIVGIVFFF